VASLFELAGSVKEAIFAALHAETAKPFRVTPPEAVVYQVLIIKKATKFRGFFD